MQSSEQRSASHSVLRFATAQSATHSAVADFCSVRRLSTLPVKRETHYLNTDLDLVAEHGLAALSAALDLRGVFPLHVDQRDDGMWYATLESEE